MIGHVDSSGRALIAVTIRATLDAPAHKVLAWIDTGFNGDLVLSHAAIEELALQSTGTIKAILANGSAISMRRYVCLVSWFGETRELEVVANEGEFPLLGVGLLLEHVLTIDYQKGTISIA